MELALQLLNIAGATQPITETFDPYKITQVHDYRSISFLRQSASVKSASRETIKVFAQNYPELLKVRLSCNFPFSRAVDPLAKLKNTTNNITGEVLPQCPGDNGFRLRFRSPICGREDEKEVPSHELWAGTSA